MPLILILVILLLIFGGGGYYMGPGIGYYGGGGLSLVLLIVILFLLYWKGTRKALAVSIRSVVDEGADQHSKLWRGEGGGCAVEDVV
jgi:hypothetical protein